MNNPTSTPYESILRTAADLEAQGDCAAALDKFEESLKLDHECPDAYQKAAEMILRHGGVWKDNKQIIPIDRAAQYLMDGLSWSHDNLNLLKPLYQAQVAAGQLHRAVQTAAKLLELSPDKAYWREQGRRTFATLDQSPQIALLGMVMSPEAENQLRRIFNSSENPELTSKKPDDQPVWLETHSSHEPKIILGKFGDFLKLVGMRVKFATRADDFWEGDVEDLSDSGTHIILRNVTLLPRGGASEMTYDRKNLAIAEIDFAEIIDRRDAPLPTGDGRVWTARDPNRDSGSQSAPPQPPPVKTETESPQPPPARKEAEPAKPNAPDTSKNSNLKSDYHERKYLRFTFVHEEALNVATEHREWQFGRYSSNTTTWNRLRQPYNWDVARPETGRDRYSKFCDYCGKQFVIEVLSLPLLIRRNKRARRMRNIGLLIILFSIVAWIANLIWVPDNSQSMFDVVFGGTTIAFFCGIILAVVGEIGKQPGYSLKGDLITKYWTDNRPFDGHYIETVESRSDSFW
jgi:tetratricopeptide (TPR) repeat protein